MRASEAGTWRAAEEAAEEEMARGLASCATQLIQLISKGAGNQSRGARYWSCQPRLVGNAEPRQPVSWPEAGGEQSVRRVSRDSSPSPPAVCFGVVGARQPAIRQYAMPHTHDAAVRCEANPS